MEVAKIGRETHNIVADTMAPVAAKKTQILVSEPVSISEKRSFPQVNSSYLHGKKSLHTGQVAHQAGAYPSFCTIKQLGVFLLPPG